MFMTPEDLKQWRIRNGYTQVTLAQALKTHSMTISKWERGERGIASFLQLALDALECKKKEVKKGKGTKKTKKERYKNGKHIPKR